MPVDYIDGVHWKLCVGPFRHTATRRIFCCSKTSQSILSSLESSLVELLSQITRKIYESSATRAVKDSYMFHCNKDISYETVASYHFAARVES